MAKQVKQDAMDEVPFQQHGSRCRMWVRPEVADPVCWHAPTRQSISYFGVVRLTDGKLVMSRPDGMFDAGTCWDFYRKLERHQRAGRKMVVIIDNARYHHARWWSRSFCSSPGNTRSTVRVLSAYSGLR